MFKKGDIVICISSSGRESILQKGFKYIVDDSSISRDGREMVRIGAYILYASRFKLADTTSLIIQKIREMDARRKEMGYEF